MPIFTRLIRHRRKINTGNTRQLVLKDVFESAFRVDIEIRGDANAKHSWRRIMHRRCGHVPSIIQSASWVTGIRSNDLECKLIYQARMFFRLGAGLAFGFVCAISSQTVDRRGVLFLP